MHAQSAVHDMKGAARMVFNQGDSPLHFCHGDGSFDTHVCQRDGTIEIMGQGNGTGGQVRCPGFPKYITGTELLKHNLYKTVPIQYLPDFTGEFFDMQQDREACRTSSRLRGSDRILYIRYVQKDGYFCCSRCKLLQEGHGIPFHARNLQ